MAKPLLTKASAMLLQSKAKQRVVSFVGGGEMGGGGNPKRNHSSKEERVSCHLLPLLVWGGLRRGQEGRWGIWAEVAFAGATLVQP